MRVNDGKGQVDRVLYLSPDLGQTLRAWSARRHAPDWLFPGGGRDSPTLATRTIYQIMMRCLRQAGVAAHYSPHCLRHAFATQLPERRGDARGAQRTDGPPVAQYDLTLHATLRVDQAAAV